jgi:GTPase SAR1 family protein
MQIKKGKQPGPRKILLYGEAGVGKSTWANEAPGTIFLNIEDGLADLDCHSSPHLQDFTSVVNCVSWLANNPHEYKTVAVDTLDWLEKLIHREVAAGANKPTIGDIPYGRGYDAAVKKWDFLLSGFDSLYRRGMGIILLAHDRVVKVNDPGMPMYEKREPDLHASSCAMLREWCQEVLFAQFRIFTRSEDQGFGRERTIATGGKERFIQTTKSASAEAKNRLNLPDELPMSWAAYAGYLPRRQAENISGVVVDGSSKAGVS